jgi:hypothetical protein
MSLISLYFLGDQVLFGKTYDSNSEDSDFDPQLEKCAYFQKIWKLAEKQTTHGSWIILSCSIFHDHSINRGERFCSMVPQSQKQILNYCLHRQRLSQTTSGGEPKIYKYTGYCSVFLYCLVLSNVLVIFYNSAHFLTVYRKLMFILKICLHLF